MSYDILCLIINPVEFQQVILIFKRSVMITIRNCLSFNQLTRKYKSQEYLFICWAGSSVGIVTDYGLDGPGSNPGRDEIFRLSRPALGPTQSSVQWVTGLSQG